MKLYNDLIKILTYIIKMKNLLKIINAMNIIFITNINLF